MIITKQTLIVNTQYKKKKKKLQKKFDETKSLFFEKTKLINP